MGTFNPSNWRQMVIKPHLLESDKIVKLNKSLWGDYCNHPDKLGSKCIAYAIIIDRKAVWVINYFDSDTMHEERVSSSELEMLYRFAKQEDVMNQLVTALI